MISYAEKVWREGKAEGRQEGKAEGEAKGKAEGLAETLLRQLEKRFSLDSARISQVRAVQDTIKLQAALDEIIEPNATAESVLEKLK